MNTVATSDPIMTVNNLHMAFKRQRSVAERLSRSSGRTVRALNGVSFTLARGETLGIVGESGCGKSTLARCLVRLHTPTAGFIGYDGLDVLKLAGAARREYNRRVQMVFQDPYGSLNPRMTVRQMLAEAISFHRLREGKEVSCRVDELLGLVRLPLDAADRYPHEFSGGQRQRIGIARALAVEPDCLIADELVSALDVSVQAEIINLLLELQQELRLSVLFIAHDLRLIRHISHRVAVMYLGSIVELADTQALFNAPAHPYSEALLNAAPNLDPTQRSLDEAVRGELPSPIAIPPGCPFHPRCAYVFDRCHSDVPLLETMGHDHFAACHLRRSDAPLSKWSSSSGALMGGALAGINVGQTDD